MSTPTFLAAFERLRAEKGLPRTIFSDNGKTFKAADKELRHLWQQFDTVEAARGLATKYPPPIEWKFIEPHAPWWGGFWERLVRSIKTAMRRTLSNQLLSGEELQTLFKSIQAQINSRPLCVVADNVNEPLSITPAHLSIGRSLEDCPDAPPTATARDDDMTRRWFHQQELQNLFWRRWTKEYLPTLTPRRKWRKVEGSLGIGDLVLVEEKSKKRGEWPMGRIVDVFKGRDGHVRSVVIKTPKTTFRRPIQLVYRLEAAADSAVEHAAAQRGEGAASAQENVHQPDIAMETRSKASARPAEGRQMHQSTSNLQG